MKLESFKNRWMGRGSPKRSSSLESELEDPRIDDPSLRLQFNEQISSSPVPPSEMNNCSNITKLLDSNMNTRDVSDAHEQV